ncbi:MAG: ABC transporter permease [Cellulomonas sp.]|uniref:FtsX-like permease family protein n=1 Tax=Cellulomonas sp. TaxID=40001 RepID=UPI00258AB8E7|nr:FtsX-like permease family protein [Cellulomonas sp.]MCR6704728.1 ABC transporter permease [Cellulomonas sp.]
MRDGVLTARAQPVATATAALVVALVTLVTLLTTGRAAATEAEVVASIDAVGTRLVVATDTTGEAGIDPATVAAIAELSSVTWVFGLGPATDVENVAAGHAGPAPLRALVGGLPSDVALAAGRAPATPDEVVVGSSAATALRMPDVAGALSDGARRYAAVGLVEGTGPLSFLDDGALRMAAPDEDVPLRYVYVLAASATHAQDVADAVRALVVADAPSAVDVSVSSGALELRDVIAGRLGASSRQTMAGVLGVGLVLVTVTMLGAVAGRRRDFGRRRALGATRSAVVSLVLVQSSCAGLAGAVLGAASGLAVLSATGVAWPTAQFVAGVMVLAALVTLVGSVPPAVAAARADPVRILRVP